MLSSKHNNTGIINDTPHRHTIYVSTKVHCCKNVSMRENKKGGGMGDKLSLMLSVQWPICAYKAQSEFARMRLIGRDYETDSETQREI